MIDVVVVGGGLSGLIAARRLVEGGAEVVVLEARDRVGGRTLSERIGAGVFDLGGQWIGPQQKRMHALAAELGIATFPEHASGRKVLEVNGKRSTYKGMIPSLTPHNLVALQLVISRLERMRKKIPLDAPERAPDAEALDSESVEAFKRRAIPFEKARGVFDAAVRVIAGAEPAELSLLHFLFYLNSGGGLDALVNVEGGAQETRFVEGAQSVSLRLAEKLGARVRLSSPVTAIEHGEGGVTVRAAGGEVKARRAILALPPTLAGRIAYAPVLPWERDQLTQRMPMGATMKCIALYRKPFWREAGLSGEAVSTGGPLTCAFDDTSHDGAQPALVGFVVGRHCRAWAMRPASERKRAVLDHLVRFFGAEAGDPIGYRELDWSLEPFTRGCPVGAMAPGTLTQLGTALRAPIGALHFAGTETAGEWNGYMEGAVESGERAAREVLGVTEPGAEAAS